MKYPRPLLQLIAELKKLPGVGHKSAERFAFHLLARPSRELDAIADAIKNCGEAIQKCADCGALSEDSSCHFCDDPRRDSHLLCLVATPKDLFAVEQTREFKGHYHVLGGTLNPIAGIGPERLKLNPLFQRIERGQIKEVIIALDSTLEGDATSLYLKQALSSYPVTVSRLAFGLPMGSSFDYVDGGTLARAFSGRLGF